MVQVILSDGDLSALANMKVNLDLNHLTTNTCTIDDLGVDHSMVRQNILCYMINYVCHSLRFLNQLFCFKNHIHALKKLKNPRAMSQKTISSSYDLFDWPLITNTCQRKLYGN